ncbi:MAG: pantothenate kinase [Leptolyngbyaceae cyanobacterium bins.59]|nr:pantothenate kinase [Leptolyngbyaceae cyanobacterium bins.59]
MCRLPAPESRNVSFLSFYNPGRQMGIITYSSSQSHWLALAIGNSRVHWAWFEGDRLSHAGHTTHLNALQVKTLSFLPVESLIEPDIWMASVVPEQTLLWEFRSPQVITLDHIPITNLYPTLGIDRALALLAAGERWEWPVLVVDGGTALTLTGADGDRQLIGGVILPGLGLQFQSLANQTAQLPQLQVPEQLPSRWARTTDQAIQSGILYTVTAGLRDFLGDWWQKFPDSNVALTGGDGAILLTYLREKMPDQIDRLQLEPRLVFQGMQIVRRKCITSVQNT